NSAPMPRTANAILGLVLAGCATSDAVPSSSFGGAAESLVPPTPIEAPEVRPRTEAELRNELATSLSPTSAALALVALMDVEERLPEALSVLAVALRRAPADIELRAARAGVFRDLGRRREAIVELESLREASPSAFGPGLWLELAELEWLEGDAEAAEAALRSLREVPTGASLLWERGDDVAWLESAVASRSRARAVRTRDLLGDLRGAEDAAHRLRVLGLLLLRGGTVAARAGVIAVTDAEPLVRSAGVAGVEVEPLALAEFCAMALSDPAPVVRVAGAKRSADLPPAEAATLLLPTMAVETDALTFIAMHDVLRELSARGEPCSAAAAAQPSVRTELLEFWQEHWAR
ncbi:MAG: hypothetical protein ABL997_01470, partial [Planctomycetota bacterium]